MKDLFKDLVFDQIVEWSLKELFSLWPFLGWGPVGLIVTHVITKYSEIFYNRLKGAIILQKIYFKNVDLQKAFDHESVKLKIISDSFDENSPEFLEAKENAKKVLSDFVHIDLDFTS